MSRKIWPPSLLTPLLLVLWISHRHRQARWGAFAWGLVGALIGQVHLSGWFVAAGLVVGTAVAEFRGSLPRSRHWHFWLLGSVLGLISAIPWARVLPTSTLRSARGVLRDRSLPSVYGISLWIRGDHASLLPFVVLGLGRDSVDFDVGPIIYGFPMHVPDLLRLFITLAVVLRIVVRLIDAFVAPCLRWTLRMISHGTGRPGNGDASASSEPAHAGGACASTAFYLWSTVALPSAIFVLTTNVYFYHYYFVLCPLLFVLVAVSLLPWRRVLLGLVIAQALLSYPFLSYVHHTARAYRGEYGLSYSRQGNE